MKKFYKTVLTVTVLSDRPYVEHNLLTVADDIDTGDCVGIIKCGESKELSKRAMTKALRAAGSDEAFFQIDVDDDSE